MTLPQWSLPRHHMIVGIMHHTNVKNGQEAKKMNHKTQRNVCFTSLFLK